MAPRPWAYGDMEGEDLPVRDRPEESFGRQGVGLPTYGDEPTAYRGAERIDLGEPMAPASRSAPSRPKGWQRSDERIHEEVCAHLTGNDHVDGSDLEVIVHHGEVTLNGTVRHKADKRRIEDIADIEGVHNVQNNLRPSERSRRWTFL